jgi:hypothetical protein
MALPIDPAAITLQGTHPIDITAAIEQARAGTHDED